VATKRRRRKETAADRFFAMLIGGLVCLAVFSFVMAVTVGVTHGFILLIIPLAVVVWIWRRRKERADGERLQRELAAWEAHKAQQQRELATDLGRLLTVSPTEFEAVVGQVLTGLGFTQMRLTKATGDRGVDLVCIDPSGRRTVVQCKQYGPANKVSGPAVRNLIGARALANAHHAMLVTTSSFTKEAVHAGQASGIHLVDGPTLVQYARQAAWQPTTPMIAGSGTPEA
jgi:restriction endonuclease Mrr